MAIHSAFESVLQLMKCKFPVEHILELFNQIEEVLLLIINDNDVEMMSGVMSILNIFIYRCPKG